MKVVGIVGSLRAGGNSYLLVEYALKKIQAQGFSTEIVELSGSNIQACKDCDICREKQSCVIEDDLTSVFGKMKWRFACSTDLSTTL